jgi:chloride channel protein, CIC family
MREERTAVGPPEKMPTRGSPGPGSSRSTSEPPNLVEAEEANRIGLAYLSLLALAVGIVTGIGAVVFRELIGFIHNLLFLGQFAFHYDAKIFTPASPWGPFVVLVPVAGAIVVTFLVSKFAPEARAMVCPR